MAEFARLTPLKGTDPRCQSGTGERTMPMHVEKQSETAEGEMSNKQLGFTDIALLLLLAALVASCKNETSTAPVNRSPVITSLYAFPGHVQSSDSFVVVCSAYEPDGDSLFYDWSCTSGASIKGAHPPGSFTLFHTRENARVFYAPDSLHTSQDSIRVDVHVRDGKGGGVSNWLFVRLSRPGQ